MKFWARQVLLTPLVILMLAIAKVITGAGVVDIIGITACIWFLISLIGLGITALGAGYRGLRSKSLSERHKIARDYANRSEW